MRELEQVVDVGRIEQLVLRLPHLVGAPIRCAEDLGGNKRFPKVPAVQLVTRPDFHRVDGHGIEIESVISFLGKLV